MAQSGESGKFVKSFPLCKGRGAGSEEQRMAAGYSICPIAGEPWQGLT